MNSNAGEEPSTGTKRPQETPSDEGINKPKRARSGLGPPAKKGKHWIDDDLHKLVRAKKQTELSRKGRETNQSMEDRFVEFFVKSAPSEPRPRNAILGRWGELEKSYKLIHAYQTASGNGTTGRESWWKLTSDEQDKKLRKNKKLVRNLTESLYFAMHEYMGNRASVVPALLVNKESKYTNQVISDSESADDGAGEEDSGSETVAPAQDPNLVGQRVRVDKKLHKSAKAANAELVDKLFSRIDDTMEKIEKMEEARAQMEQEGTNRMLDIMKDMAQSLKDRKGT